MGNNIIFQVLTGKACQIPAFNSVIDEFLIKVSGLTREIKIS